MATRNVSVNAAHHLQQAGLFLADLMGRDDLPDEFDKVTIKLLLDVTDASRQYIDGLTEACEDGG